ncbi:MAG: sugar transferase [Lachnospiraceae bacterium]|nr:sugar transferase [Lachnospiraceae bacterium]
MENEGALKAAVGYENSGYESAAVGYEGEDYEAAAAYNHVMRNIFLVCKRAADILFSLAGMILLSWLFLIIAVIVAVREGRPIIHKRKCIGRNGRQFYMYKFRTMVVDADNLEKYMSAEQIKEYKELCKLDNDPRITRTGKFLRKTSLDELPQLLNVFLGTMSLVGPRPVVRSEAEEYGDNLSELLSVRPGITGYWQVYGRGEKSYIGLESKQQQQLYYTANCGFILDIKIMLHTVLVVFSGKGAK